MGHEGLTEQVKASSVYGESCVDFRYLRKKYTPICIKYDFKLINITKRMSEHSR